MYELVDGYKLEVVSKLHLNEIVKSFGFWENMEIFILTVLGIHWLLFWDHILISKRGSVVNNAIA